MRDRSASRRGTVAFYRQIACADRKTRRLSAAFVQQSMSALIAEQYKGDLTGVDLEFRVRCHFPIVFVSLAVLRARRLRRAHPPLPVIVA